MRVVATTSVRTSCGWKSLTKDGSTTGYGVMNWESTDGNLSGAQVHFGTADGTTSTESMWSVCKYENSRRT